MLQLTSRAAAMLRDERSERGIPDSFGLRVQRSEEHAGLRLQFVDGPLDGDEVGATEGLGVFVAPEVADALASQTLDVHEAAGSAGLVLRDQNPDGAWPNSL
jgi:hypothetical protein